MGIWVDFVDALDELREVKREWQTRSSMSGFYDPCGDAERHAKADIAAAEDRVRLVFALAVDTVGCNCDD